ncbi:MAG: hypothetical protein NT031_12490 [Planctomycetota bacterium]|nr:hypothetical protein [Planctomycetota bacterium]
MDTQRAARELTVIRQLMERPIRYSTMSGGSGVLAGLAALGGCLADWCVSRAYPPESAFWINAGVWGAVLAVALAGTLILTRIREVRQGMPFWSSIKKRILLTILPPFLAGVGLTVAIAARWYAGRGPNEWGLIPALWMTFYAVALWQVGDFAPIDVRVLSVFFLVSRVVAAVAFQDRLDPYWSLGVTFGGYHIVYGTAVWIRHGG